MENKSTFDNHLQKIMKVLNMTVEYLVLYQSASKTLLYPQDVHINDQAIMLITELGNNDFLSCYL